jgi:muramoyltetrapeptide carboxypeptidase
VQSLTLRPPRVARGDTVAVVSPSGPAAGAFPHRVRRGVAYLESLGLRVRLMPNATRVDGWVSAPAPDRAADIHAAFLDDEVTVVLAAIGGNHSNALLEHLDWDLIREHPKVFQGYSDVTVLHWALAKRVGLSTFYGPALVAELAEFPAVLPLTDRALRAAWFGGDPLRLEAAVEWTDEFLDWRTGADLERPRELRPSRGWRTIRAGVAKGPLLGGCLETICWHLKGSPEWIDPAGTILFLETSEERPSPAHVDAYLTDLRRLGVFAVIAGLVFARPYGYDDAQADALWRVVAEHTADAGIPVLGDVDVGHTDPMLTVPLGVPARLDAAARAIHLLEPATAFGY